MKARTIWGEMKEQIYMIKIRAHQVRQNYKQKYVDQEAAQLIKEIEALEKNIEAFCEIPQDEYEVCRKIAIEYMQGNHNQARKTLRMYALQVAGCPEPVTSATIK